MSKEVEIEFKNLLTKEEYEQLLTVFSVAPNQINRQINRYFDTPNASLRGVSATLRLRETSEKTVCTLKEKQSKHIQIETTEVLTKKQVKKFLKGESLEAPSVVKELEKYNIPLETLRCFGELTTDRVEFPFEGGLLVLDHSFYEGIEDYEIEYETYDERIGEETFTRLLQTYDIPKRKTPKKIARLERAKTNK